ncbi:MAG: ATP-dependent RecD-like DNA helicase [Chitinophagaceae bacterium]|nr:ATP-dependent RecD-like DNA helicase [Oligoflexus sp.]
MQQELALEGTSNLTVIQGELQKISFQNSENGWTVARLRTSDAEPIVTVVGHFGKIRPGEFCEVHGEWTENKKFGKQFKALHINIIYPKSVAGILRYLKSGVIKGIGEKTAEAIVKHFGDQTLEVLDNDPDRLLSIPKIGKRKKIEIIRAWNERKKFRDVEIFLSANGISPAFITRIIRIYGADAPERVQQDPYCLARDVPGIGFISADAVAQQVGIELDSPLRVKAALSYQLEVAEGEGHCFQTRDQLNDSLSILLKIPRVRVEELLENALGELLETESIVFDEAPGIGDVYYSKACFDAEAMVASQVARLLSAPMPNEPGSGDRIERWLKSYSEASGQPFSPEQLAAVKTAVESRVFILTGGPGVGKTTTANAIIRLLIKMGRSVSLGAPTGRAAQRLSEVAAVGAKTIHRLLEWSASEHTFLRDEVNPLDSQVVIIDEASMLDIHLAAALMRSLKPNGQIIFIGDVDQLPSVGPGNVLRDLIESKAVPFTKLAQIFRQAAGSAIVQAAHMINRGEIPVFPEANNTDCQFLIIDDPADIKDAIKTLVHTTLPKSGYDPIKDIQVLTPMNRGPLGTHVLNEDLQNLLNPPAAGIGEKLETDNQIFRPGDKVIQTVNNYDLNVFNGDIGYIEHAGFDGGQLLVNFVDRKITYTKDDAYDLKLAYAITIHKAQGSEFPVVIIPVSMQHFIMLQRNLIYTALTRARKLAILIGTPTALLQAIKTQTSLKRQTLLVQRLNREP